MAKLLLVSTAVLVAALPAVAMAQTAPSSGASCPPGSWFCADTPQPQPAPAGHSGQTLRPLPDPDAAEPSSSDGDASEETKEEKPPARPPPPPPRHRPIVVVHAPPPPPPGAANWPDVAPYYPYHPHRPLSKPQEWGLNLHAEGAMIGGGSTGNAGMAGGGLGLRFKPVRAFGIEADLDLAGGDHDYQGNKRNETSFTINGLLFLNPRSRAQIYLLAGFGWSDAHVMPPDGSDLHYDYFGGQAGAGLELRLTHVLALNMDIRGFIRGRTDTLAQTTPEFQDPAGCASSPSATTACRTTNSSGGGLVTGGMTLYF